MASPFATLPSAVTALSEEPAVTALSEEPADPEAGSAAPLHYGDPLGEQRALQRGEALVHLGDRAVVEVSGPERLTWLETITSQALTGLEPGASTELLILDPQGRVEHAAGLIDDGAAAWLIADTGDVAGLAAWLTRMVFRAQVQVRVRPELAVVGAAAGGAAEDLVRGHALAEAGMPLVWRDPWPGVTAGGHGYAPIDPHPGALRPWVEAIVDAAGLDALAAAVGQVDATVRPAGLVAADALRIAAWRPRWTGEVGERTLPHEVDWLRTAVHLNKGCYRGQETVAKVHNLGHPPRRLTLLHLDGRAAAPGAVVRDGEREAGVVTSAAYHYELGPIALALLKRSVDIAVPLEVETDDGVVAAAQEVIVPPTAGAAASVPRLPRLGGRR